MPSLRTALSLSLALGAASGCKGCGHDAQPPADAPTATAPAASSAASADAPPPANRTALPEYRVPRVADGAIAIDGTLAEAGWASAPWSDAFVSPGNGEYHAASPVNARFRMAWDARALYFAVEVADAAASSSNARDAVDPHIWATASGIELMLQPGNHGDNLGYYEVQVDTAEAVWDTRFDDYNRPIEGEGDARTFGHQSWDAQLERRVTVTAGTGYVVEAALPWTALAGARAPAPPPANDTWRANVYAFRDGQRHATAWSPIMGEGNFHRSSRFGMLVFTTSAPEGSE
mgnify:CR=1 FL=1